MEIIYSKIPRGVRSDVYLDIMTLTNVHTVKQLFFISKNQSILYFLEPKKRGRIQLMVILDLQGIPFHDAVDFASGYYFF